MKGDFSEKFELIKAWWHCENDRPLIGCIKDKSTGKDMSHIQKLLSGANKYWSSTNSYPDYKSFVHHCMDALDGDKIEYGDNLPIMHHLYGARGTPMTISYYIGGNIKLGDETVWIDPVINDWQQFNVKFDPDNVWWQRSLALLKKSCEIANENFVVSLPDLGDALTCFSLLRGPEKLLFDLIDNKQIMLKAIENFVAVWVDCHKRCWDIYKNCYPGDCTWLNWAPGKSYAVQCDFSTILSPNMFKEFVVLELEMLSDYLEYMVFHLDGQDEIKHLDILLDMPMIKAIQWVPGAGKPTACHWLDLLKKIQKSGKSICCYSESTEETKILKKELLPKGLWINEWF